MKLKTKLLVCSACLSSLLGLSSCSQPQTVQPGTISADGSSSAGQINGSVWTDTQGNAIQAHDNIIKYGDTYYWYGMDYSKNLLNGGTGGFKAIKCYASKDLVNWEFRNNVVTSNSSSLLNHCDINTPRVLFNKRTGKFVMWMGYNTTYWRGAGTNYGTWRTTRNNLFLDEYLVATCSTPDGAFDIEGGSFGLNSGAVIATLFQDTNGDAYVLDYSTTGSGAHALHINKLSYDYLRLGEDSYVTNLFPETEISRTAVVKYNGMYYLFAASFVGEMDSDDDGWPNVNFCYFDAYRGTTINIDGVGKKTGVPRMNYTGVRYACAPSMAGPWSGLETFGPDYADAEFNSVLTVQGNKETSYILMFNRWNTADLSLTETIWQPLEFTDVSSTASFSRPSFADNASFTIDAASGKVTIE